MIFYRLEQNNQAKEPHPVSEKTWETILILATGMDTGRQLEESEIHLENLKGLLGSPKGQPYRKMCDRLPQDYYPVF
ncbi:hypothetical protein [Planktothrix sp. FACHB-1365]|uniref:hypothetical protein n=1 Tax=Planktothrix sp. FACHB-1365 TaxID=2692855 RepID=UPI00168639A8|nr:hypothetical protein [Planktothrix sp. FACHB-1365]MBD2482192.1 hypothetical protein [Planktothrix sp. FACHB-1365]